MTLLKGPKGAQFTNLIWTAHQSTLNYTKVDQSTYTKYKVEQFLLKFIYSEKATKFCEISTNYLTGST